MGQVREWYVVSYEEIRDFPRPVTVDEEIKFAELLKVGEGREAAPGTALLLRGIYSISSRGGSCQCR